MTNTFYQKGNIQSMTPLEFTRHQPGVYAGDTNFTNQLLIELLANSIDEVRLGHGTKIEVTRKVTSKMDKKVNFIVRDYGQGFLVNSLREDGETEFQAAFDVMNTSGKYDADGVYQGNSLGAYGIGAKLPTFLSHWLIAETVNAGKKEKIYFKEGVFEKRELRDAAKDEPTGTTVTFEPSEQFFTTTDINIDDLRNKMKQQCALNPTLTIEFDNNGVREEFYSPDGLMALLKDAEGKKVTKPFQMNFHQGKFGFEMAFQYTSDWRSTVIPFVNSGLTESGPHITALKSLFTREFNKFFKTKDWGKDDKLTGDDIQEGLFCVFNITTIGHSYDAQVKSRVTKLDMTPFTKAITEELWYWMENNENDLRVIYDKATTAKKAKEAERRVRDKIRAAATSPKKQPAKKFDSKLADCSSFNRKECSIIITEGK